MSAVLEMPRPMIAVTPAPAPERLLGLDAARLLATLGVIWFHSLECEELRPSGVLGRYSVAFYTLAAMVFLVQSAQRRRRPVWTYALDRLRRLGIPFVGWGLITVAVMYAVVATGYPLDLPGWSWDRVVDGGTLHLWYLPFLFVASVGVYPFAITLGKGRTWRWIIAGLAAAMALSLDCGLWDRVASPTGPVVGRFFELTGDRWSVVYWGVAAAILWSSGVLTSRWRTALAAIGAAVLVGATVWQWRHGLDSLLKIYGGVGLLALSLAAWTHPLVRFLAPLGRMSAGVYFAHMAAIYAVRDGLMFKQISHGPARDIAVFLGATALSFAAIALMRTIPGLTWLAGDERARNRTAVKTSAATP